MNFDQSLQAKAPEPVTMTAVDFEAFDGTAVYWLTGAGIMLNSHGTIILVDPILSFISDNPLLSEVEGTPQYTMPPIAASDIVRADAVLYTHADPDHLGELTVLQLNELGVMFHGTPKVKERLLEIGVPDNRIVAYAPKASFKIGGVRVQMTVADHPWQLDFPERESYVYKPEDCCGYKFYTPNGVIWDPGDSKLLDEHFNNLDADLIFMDFEDNSPLHHFGTENALKLVNYLEKADIIMYHWGTYYAPNKSWFAANPDSVRDRIKRNERFLEPHPGEKVIIDYT